MNNRVLSPAENEYVSTLARRLLHISKQAEGLKRLPLEDIHEETGLPVFALLCLLMDAAGWTETEMYELLSEAQKAEGAA